MQEWLIRALQAQICCASHRVQAAQEQDAFHTPQPFVKYIIALKSFTVLNFVCPGMHRTACKGAEDIPVRISFWDPVEA